ncbi:hypothetical protein ACFLU6_10520, partial [Acidobacteriota bacterium]
SQDWRYYLPLDKDTETLLVGPQIGDLAMRLTDYTDRLTVACPVLEAAQLIRKRSVALDREIRVVHAEGVPDFPFPADSFEVVIVTRPVSGMIIHQNTEGSANRDDLKALLGDIKAKIRPGGTLFIACENSTTLSWATVTAARSAGHDLLPEDRDSALSMHTRDRSHRLPFVRIATGDLSKTLESIGFGNIRLYAPVPDAIRPKAVLPLDHKGAVYYFLDHLVRRTTPAARSAIRAAKLALSLGFFTSAMPFLYATARKPGSDSGSEKAGTSGT